jgi:hypothetical protein
VAEAVDDGDRTCGGVPTTQLQARAHAGAAATHAVPRLLDELEQVGRVNLQPPRFFVLRQSALRVFFLALLMIESKRTF